MPDLPDTQLPVTVIVPAKNEEGGIGACLSRLGRFARVVVVDSRSADRTPEIAREHGAEVLDFEWDGQFPKKRNWALRTLDIDTEWVLLLDADELVTEAFCDELADRLGAEARDGFLGVPLRHGDRMRKLALVRSGHGEYEHIAEDGWSKLDMEVHEHVVVDGSVDAINASLIHRDVRSIGQYVERHDEYAAWEAARYQALRDSDDWAELTLRQRIKYRVMGSYAMGPCYFAYSYILKLGFLDGRAGLAYSVAKMIYFLQVALRIRAASVESASADADDPTV